MQAGTHPNTATEFDHELTCWAMLGNIRREIEKLSLTRETSDLPIDTDTGSGIIGATCEITWAEQAEQVQEMPATPWRRINGWPPIAEQPIEIWAQYAGYSAFRLFTGYIEESSTDVYEGVHKSAAADNSRRLDETLTQDALCWAMPSWADTVAGFPLSSTSPTALIRRINLSQGFMVDRALRRCGFGGIPMSGPATLLSVPMVGSLLPEVGELREATEAHTVVRGPERSQIKTIDPVLWHAAGRRVDAGNVLYVWLEIGTGALQKINMWGLNVDVAVGHNPATGLVFCDMVSAGTSLTIPRQAGVNTLLLKAENAAGQIRYTLTHGSQTRTGQQASKTNGDLTDLWVRLNRENVTGGIYIEQGTSAAPTLYPWQRSVCTFTDRDLAVIPALIRKSTRELLREWSASTMNFLFADEFGGIVASEVRTMTPVTIVPTQLERMVAETSSSSVRSRLEVAWREPQITSGPYATYGRMGVSSGAYAYGALPDALLWRGGEITLEPGESREDFIHPGENEDWINPWLTWVDPGFTPWPAGHNDTYEAIHWDAGPTILSGIQITREPDANETSVWVGGYLQKQLRYVDPRTWFLSLAYTPPADDPRQCRTVFRDGGRTYVFGDGATYSRTWGDMRVPAHQRNKSALILAGYAKVIWQDRISIGATLGPSTARVKTHNAQWWVQYPDDAQDLADRLSAFTGASVPMLQEVDITPDLRLQLLDRIRINDSDSGIDITGFLVKIRLEIEAGNASMSVGIRPTQQAMTYTLADQDTAFAGDSLSFFDYINGQRTLGQMDANPINRIR